ncbi:MAG: endolytic transglycosylase MltG [Clostridia bacterium]|nr:endolytic transglycosylase MltG [Clostridia bacterium]
MDEKRSENTTFEQLTQEEKKRLIAALGMGRLTEDERRQFADMVRRSRLSETERVQIKRAYEMSKLTDEERTALIARRQAARSASAEGAENPAAEQTAVVQSPAVQNPASAQMQTATVRSTDDARTRAHTVVREARGEDTAPSEETVAVTQPLHRTKQAAAFSRSAQEEPEAQEEHEADYTAITSLLKGIVYIVAVLVISVFASWTIIEVANDVFAFVKSDEVISVVIEEDMTSADVAQLLHENGIIKYPTIYELFVRIKGESTDYLVGEYEISPSMNYGDINDAFTYIVNTKEQVVITIPEGYTIDQIIDLMLKNGIGTREGFIAAINEYEYTGYRFLEGLDETDPDRKYRLEGYLFPDTYFFFKDSSEVAVIDKFLVNFERKVSEPYYERAKQLGMSMDDLIILASMVQAEGRSLTDFENISSVFHNRLANPRSFPKMQSDATLQYILDKRKQELSASDLQIDSKYNSYMYPGLPPGSICNPGMDAINCALYPAETDYYYFLADGKGNTYFSRTNEEHEKLKDQYINKQN